MTQSKLAFSNGNCSTSLSRKSTSRPKILEFSIALSTNVGVKSAPTTFAPNRAAVKASTPVPHPTSKTLSFAFMPANLTTFGAAVPVKFSNKVKSDQTTLAFSFNSRIILNSWSSSIVIFIPKILEFHR